MRGIQFDAVDGVTLDTNIIGNVFTIWEKAGQPLLYIPQILVKKEVKLLKGGQVGCPRGRKRGVAT